MPLTLNNPRLRNQQKRKKQSFFVRVFRGYFNSFNTSNIVDLSQMLNLIVTWRELKSRDKLHKESRIHRRESKLICITLDLNHFTMSLCRQQTEKESCSLISVPKLVFCFVLSCYRRQLSYLLMCKNKKKKLRR